MSQKISALCSPSHSPPSLRPQAGSDAEEDEIPYRVCIAGAQGVGKTALIHQFRTSECINAYDVNPSESYHVCET